MQLSPIVKICTSFYRKPTSLWIWNLHFNSVPKQMTLEIKLSKFTIDSRKEKNKITHTAHCINTLKNNDYPTSIKRHLNNKKSRKLHTPSYICFLKLPCPVRWGCRIHWLLLCRGVRPPPNECPGYDTKQSDAKVPAVLELWGIRSTPSLPSLPCPLWTGVVAPDRVLSMG